ncbi:hypothetical protein F6S85_02635 [Bifidobacterium dentium]|nr:hypothetical protein [Bifidobacterium dentium]
MFNCVWMACAFVSLVSMPDGAATRYARGIVDNESGNQRVMHILGITTWTSGMVFHNMGTTEWITWGQSTGSGEYVSGRFAEVNGRCYVPHILVNRR